MRILYVRMTHIKLNTIINNDDYTKILLLWYLTRQYDQIISINNFRQQLATQLV